ncbi:MAG: tetratricopeptide repeat protein [Kiritimatiellaeota bacterium]|nr:tetratricopeptide repeat protein [Kiritimatiellota bacterium]
MEKLINLGYKALQTAQSSTAISFFEKVLKQEPQNKRARAGLATVMIQTDKHQAAIALLEPMIKEFPDDYTLKNNLAWVLATTRDPALRNGPRAIQLAQDALLSAPGDGHVWSTLAEAYAISGHYKKALRSAEQALQLGRASNMEAQLVEDYRQQVERCRKAAETTAILE